jgi:hypothetical protein
MTAISKAYAFLLLAAMTVGSTPVQIPVSRGIVHERPASCHEDARKIPAPEPISHRCCQIGHQPAILHASSSDSQELPLRILPAPDHVDPELNIAALESFPNPLIPTGDPPTLAPLRI